MAYEERILRLPFLYKRETVLMRLQRLHIIARSRICHAHKIADKKAVRVIIALFRNYFCFIKFFHTCLPLCCKKIGPAKQIVVSYKIATSQLVSCKPVSYTHLRAHET